MTAIVEFCKTKDIQLLKTLDDYTKQIFIAASKYCIENKIGRQDIAHIVEQVIGKWRYKIIPKGTLLYRGTKTLPDEANRATYYAPDIDTANIYLPSNKQGFLNVYKVKDDIMLFELDNVSNANNLLSDLFPDKTVVYHSKTKNYETKDTMYDLVRAIYTSEFAPSQKDDQPLIVSKLRRYSITKKDIIFANWLCDQGFKGYSAGRMKQNFGHYFPAEVMLCKPKNLLELVANIQMRKTKSATVLQNIAKKYEEN